MRRKMGAAALELDSASDGSWPTQWRATVAARVPRTDWPYRDVRITAVDARIGEPVVFDRHSGVGLVDAVAASCSSRMPYHIGNGRYIDGGYRRNENADLASGCERVLVLSPVGGRTLHPLSWRMQLAAQIEELCALAARSRQSCRTVNPSTCSVPARWTSRCVRPQREPASIGALRSPESSASSGTESLGSTVATSPQQAPSRPGGNLSA
jgi:NTE family protein